MANQLDLEEQEQLDQIKAFWKQYGNLITWALIAVLGAFAAWNLYQRWQTSQATDASALYDELDRVAKSGDVAKVERVFTDIKDKFPSTTYAQQGALLVAKIYFEAGKAAESKAALTWVAEKSSDDGYQAIARLRLAALLVNDKAYDEALKQLVGKFPSEFSPLVADRKGDVFMLQSKKAEARAEYEKAYKEFDERTEYRRLVEVKLNGLGVNPKPDAATPGELTKPVEAKK
jgi:predicted negative regulator of RcsB-dependent stress response